MEPTRREPAQEQAAGRLALLAAEATVVATAAEMTVMTSVAEAVVTSVGDAHRSA